ncbi:hypothetical protein KFE25_003802 [Diacronema lutheri]|uniref:Caffeoyl-CoA O-methyltransferase n=1 Tax=Diacronema lutheri TaxID=2081491 RepID=A0A8J5XFB6_DIALT|nr:hypothetical protein KFE25_003802 [Diacronema lutheri]
MARGVALVLGALALLGAARALRLPAARALRGTRAPPATARRRLAHAAPRGAFSASALAEPAAEQAAAAAGGAGRDEEAVFMAKTAADEEVEKRRLAELKATNMTAFVYELQKYVDQINATGPPPLAPDNELRDVVLRSSTPPSRLIDDIYNYTFRSVPYEDAMYICAPEQATLLHLLARVMRARECLDVGSFTGYSAGAVMQALPASGRLTAIEIRGEYAAIASRFLSQLPARLETRVGDALAELRALEAEGRLFDFITIDADKQQQQQYYEMCLRLLRPRGLLVMFGMMLYPTEEDKEAIDGLISLVANDTRVTTTMLPVGCGVQICTKKGERALTGPLVPPADLPPAELRAYMLEAELAAIDVALADAERARETGGRYVPRPPPGAPEPPHAGGGGGGSGGDGDGGATPHSADVGAAAHADGAGDAARVQAGTRDGAHAELAARPMPVGVSTLYRPPPGASAAE